MYFCIEKYILLLVDCINIGYLDSKAFVSREGY